MSNEYRIVGLEDKETDSGAKLYVHLVNRYLIKKQIDEMINEDKIKELRWVVKSFLDLDLKNPHMNFATKLSF